jgi:hypothetical protein
MHKIYALKAGASALLSLTEELSSVLEYWRLGRGANIRESPVISKNSVKNMLC